MRAQNSRLPTVLLFYFENSLIYFYFLFSYTDSGIQIFHYGQVRSSLLQAEALLRGVQTEHNKCPERSVRISHVVPLLLFLLMNMDLTYHNLAKCESGAAHETKLSQRWQFCQCFNTELKAKSININQNNQHAYFPATQYAESSMSDEQDEQILNIHE